MENTPEVHDDDSAPEAAKDISNDPEPSQPHHSVQSSSNGRDSPSFTVPSFRGDGQGSSRSVTMPSFLPQASSGGLAYSSGATLTVSDPNANIQPVSLEVVEREAEPIFVTFIQERFLVDQSRHNIPFNLPSPSLSSGGRFPTESGNPFDQSANVERRVAHKLVELSDVLDRDHGPDFDLVLNFLGANVSNVSEHFEGVANVLFKDGDRNWGRVVALFYLGYRMGLACLRQGVSDFLRRLGSTFMSILHRFNLLEWVAQHGGWRTVLLLAYNCMETLPTFCASAVTVAGVLLLTWALSLSLGFMKRN